MYLENLVGKGVEYNLESFFSTIVFCIIAYLIGSINFGQIISSLKKKDLGKEGSKNYGATNAGRILGKKFFVLVFAGDFLKCVFAILIFTLISQKVHFFKNSIFGVSLIFLIVGHCWPIWFKFKGGKGVATIFGTILMINWIFFIILLISFFIITFIFKKISVGSLFSVVLFLFLTFFQPFFSNNLIFKWSLHWDIIFFSLISCIIIFIKHKENIKNFKRR